jgi:heme A synthase
MRRLFALAALVMFIFALIAAARTTGTFLSTNWPVWIAAGFVAFAADQVLGGQLTKR